MAGSEQKSAQEKKPLMRILLTLALVLVPGAFAQDNLADFRPVVVKTAPSAGSESVDPALTEIQVVFSRKMLDKSWSVVQINPDLFPKTQGQGAYSPDGKTFLLKVKLEPGKTYALWFNQGVRFDKFKDSEGKAAVPYLLYFQTKK
ncbi:MAG: hypothetical protein EXR99_09685 [Gemmataceae bacterium]|nr:hypothetical protein [Gemmataceae bacterium]